MKKLLLLIAATLTGTLLPIKAQEQSPYSMMGYGVLNDYSSSAQRAMGGVGYAANSRSRINVKNPASFAAIDSTTFLFDIGVDVGSVHASEKGLADNKPLGGLDYITLQVPIGKWMGASVGLLPYSSVGYKFGQEVTNGESSYQGQGGISEAYLGWAARPLEGLSVGVMGGYLFGNVINDVYVGTTTGSTSLYERVLQVRDYDVRFGVQYGVNVSRRNRLSAGVTYSLGHKVHGTGYGVKYNVSDTSAKPDTIGLTSLKHGYSLPWTLGAGLAWEWDDRLLVGADFTYQPWSKAKFDGIEGFSEPLQLANRYKAALGAEFTPGQRGGFMRRLTYRIGAYGAQDYTMISGNHVRGFGVSCGIGIPTPMRTRVNVGFEYRRRATTPEATVTENYYMVTLGIALNELWFLPSRIR